MCLLYVYLFYCNIIVDFPCFTFLRYYELIKEDSDLFGTGQFSCNLENWCFWTVVLEKTLESPLDTNKIQSVHPKGDESWVFFGRTDVEAETPILWPPDEKSWLIGKDPDAGKDWGQKEKGKTEDTTARLNWPESDA